MLCSVDSVFHVDSDRIAEYDLKLMDIDSDKLGIPETDYDARVTMPSSEFSRIVRDLSQLGESVRIEITKEGVRFTSEGEAANGSVLLKQSEAIGRVPKKEADEEEEEDEEKGDEDEDEDEDKPKKIKKEKKKVKKEDGDVEMNGDEEDGEDEYKGGSDDEGEEEQEEDESPSKKRKRPSSSKVS